MREFRHIIPWTSDLARTTSRRHQLEHNTIGYIGWTGRGNLGDEVMLEAAKSLYANRIVEVFSGVRREAILKHMSLSGSNFFGKAFLGGGTLINHGYLGVVRQALKFGIPLSTLGTGVGNPGFGSSNNLIDPEWKGVLKQFNRIGVRGPLSANKLRKIGIDAEVTGDLALALTPKSFRPERKANLAILNASLPSNATDELLSVDTMIDSLAGAARELLSQGLRILPVAFCAEDRAPLVAVLERAGLPVNGIVYPKTASEFFKIAEPALISVGVRLHCTVLSCCVGALPVGIAYRDKGHDFAASMQMPDMMISPKNLDTKILVERVANACENSEKLGSSIHAKSLVWRRKIEEYARSA